MWLLLFTKRGRNQSNEKYILACFLTETPFTLLLYSLSPFFPVLFLKVSPFIKNGDSVPVSRVLIITDHNITVEYFSHAVANRSWQRIYNVYFAPKRITYNKVIAIIRNTVLRLITSIKLSLWKEYLLALLMLKLALMYGCSKSKYSYEAIIYQSISCYHHIFLFNFPVWKKQDLTMFWLIISLKGVSNCCLLNWKLPMPFQLGSSQFVGFILPPLFTHVIEIIQMKNLTIWAATYNKHCCEISVNI